MNDAQHYIDSAYPPTMTFNVKTLAPTKVLKQRLDLINKHFADFFQGESLLDIGCSKGYFSLSSADKFNEIEAIDQDAECLALAKSLSSSEKITFLPLSFRNYISTKQVDKIFLGNVVHQLFKEIDGWDWICKLAALSCGDVLIEGAVSTKCKDIYEYIPQSLHSKYNDFLRIMTKYFKLLLSVPSVSYTPDRYMMLFRKKQYPKYELSKLPVLKVIREMNFRTFLTKIGFMKKAIAKVCLEDQPIWRDMNRIRIASCSPVSNGMIGEIWDKGECVGWLESYSRRRKYRYSENEKELFKKICVHNTFLSKLGYVDLDPATINFFKGSNLMFDKSCVFPIQSLKAESIDVFPILFNQSYRQINPQVGLDVATAIKTGNPVQVEVVFREAMKQYVD